MSQEKPDKTMSFDGVLIADEEFEATLARVARTAQWHWFWTWHSDEETRLQYARGVLNSYPDAAPYAKVAANERCVYVFIRV